ncbi:hypothetical protein CDD83_9749 [Cordyceps sp. RAO-2017]|nr:hypothetical protein CDD83_9749 [Cordyceps sp. RAO-2017]
MIRAILALSAFPPWRSAVAAHSLVFTGATVKVDDIPYFVSPDAVGRISSNFATRAQGLGLTPVTVLTVNTSSFESRDLQGQIKRFREVDDVFQDGFLQALIVQQRSSNSKIASPQPFGDSQLYRETFSSDEDELPTGPYFASAQGLLFRAYRLYADEQGAFSETVISNADGSHSVLAANVQGQSLAVAVPSRLYYTKTAAKPLAGVRLGVKDIFDVKGIKTSNGNRAWYSLYPPANRTSLAVQRLEDAGAVIVGKMKTSHFALGETATSDWVDYHAPFNPRGDGYQDPSSSSAGPAAGVASYPWLDMALGSDTGGSIRSPSQVQGIFGNRPSHGLVSLHDAMPISPEFDTAGLLARDPVLWTRGAQALYGDNLTLECSYPSSVLTIGFPTKSSSQLDSLLLDFLGNLTSLLAADAAPLDIDSAWTKSHPRGPALRSFVNNTYEILSAKQQARLVRDPFFADYAAAHDGRLPFVNPAPLKRWAFGESSPSTIEEAVANKTQFMDWFNREVLTRDPASCSKQLLVYVPRRPAPKYRDTYLAGPALPQPFSTSRLSVLSEAPDMVVPIGQAAYESTVTKHTEHLPVTVDLMAAKGCDGMLFSLIETLLHRGMIRASRPGRSNVDGGEVLV